MDRDSGQAIRIISDAPLREGRGLKEDRLDFAHYAQTLARVIAESGEEELTIGVFGEWGTGKTSLMRMIESTLESDHRNHLTVWFNAWRYQNELHPLLPLVGCILSRLDSPSGTEFCENTDVGVWKALKDGLGALLESLTVSLSGLPAAPLSPGLTIDGARLKRAWKRTRSGSSFPATLQMKAFAKLDAVALPPGKRVVVFVDDMDRCMPDVAVKLLEAIKLAMARPGFVFVLGLSPTTIEEYLAHRYSEDFGVQGFKAREYLEKIVQLSFYIPDHRGRIGAFSRSLLEAISVDERAAFNDIVPLIEGVCQSVPRAAIRFLNSIIIARAILESFGADGPARNVPLSAFAVDRLLQLVWTDVHAELVSSDALCQSVSRWLAVGGEAGAEAVFQRAKDDKALSQLLLSGPGHAWLSTGEWRKATAMFQVSRQEREHDSGSSATPRRLPTVSLQIPGPDDYRQMIGSDGQFDPARAAEYLADNGWALTWATQTRLQESASPSQWRWLFKAVVADEMRAIAQTYGPPIAYGGFAVDYWQRLERALSDPAHWERLTATKSGGRMMGL